MSYETEIDESEIGRLYFFKPKVPNSSFLIDTNLASEIADIHRENIIYAVFFGTVNRYPISKHYCKENETRPIEVVSAVDLADVFNYLHRQPKDHDFGYIPHERLWRKMDKLQELLEEFGRKIIDVQI